MGRQDSLAPFSETPYRGVKIIYRRRSLFCFVACLVSAHLVVTVAVAGWGLSPQGPFLSTPSAPSPAMFCPSGDGGGGGGGGGLACVARLAGAPSSSILPVACSRRHPSPSIVPVAGGRRPAVCADWRGYLPVDCVPGRGGAVDGPMVWPGRLDRGASRPDMPRQRGWR